MALDQIELKEAVAHVLAGKTVEGEDCFAPVPFPENGELRFLLEQYTADYYRSISVCEITGTLFIRKLAFFLIRHQATDLRTSPDLLDGLLWFLDHPDQVFTPLSFAGAVRRRRQRLAERIARSSRKPLIDAMDTPLPALSELFRVGDTFLVEVIHPRQMMEVGLRARNCMAHMFNGTPYPNLRYWEGITKGRVHVYALWLGKRLGAVFSAGGGELREWEYVAAIHEVAPFILPSLTAVEQQLGALDLHSPAIIHQRSLQEDGDPAVTAYRHAIGGKHDART